MLEGPAGPAIALTFGRLQDSSAKTAHGLLRGGDRFEMLGLVDAVHAGHSPAGLFGTTVNDVPIFATSTAAVDALGKRLRYAVIGVAFPGGRLPEECRGEVAQLLKRGVSIVSGLHQPLGEDTALADAASIGGARIFDIRRPRPWHELHFWNGSALAVTPPVVAVLGTDCALGKRTTARIAMEGCRRRGLSAEMIYTGQTGWLQGFRYGFILDATLNDFVSGELEHAIVRCAQEAQPDLILIEGQSSLRNPTGPCGAELLLSGNARHVVLQAAPGRAFYKGTESHGCRLPAIADEIELIGRYGSQVVALTLNGEGVDPPALAERRRSLEAELGLPVVLPLEDAEPLVNIIAGLVREAALALHSRG